MQSYPYLIVALVLVMTWTLVLAFELDLRVGAIGSVVALFALAGFLAWQMFQRSTASRRKKKANDAVEPPASTHELMYSGIEKAEQRIKAVHQRLAKHATSPLVDSRYHLPWYLVIGPPKSGKSTVVKNSGLRFAYTSLTNDESLPKNIQNTDHLHVWLADDAVVADTAGRYSSDSKCIGEWKQLIQTLKKLRPRHSLEAIVVAINAEDIQSKSPEQLKTVAEQLRQQIQIVNTTTQSSYPVYIILTHTDRLQGFAKFVKRLETHEHQLPWGIKLNPRQSNQDLRPIVSHDLMNLGKILHERCMQDVMRENEVKDAEALHRFSRNLSRLARPVSKIAGTLGTHLRTQDPLQLRALHFTGFSQPDDSPPTRAPRPQVIQGSLATSFHHPPANVNQLFLPHYFHQVLLPDQGLAGPGRKMRRRLARRNRSLAICAFIGALGLCSLPLFSANKNRELQREFEQVLLIAKPYSQSTEPQLLPRTLWKQSARLDEKFSSFNDDRPLDHRLGMYQGDQLALNARNLFLGLAIQHGVAPLVHRDELVLTRLANQPGALGFSQVQSLRDSLYRYLLLTRGEHQKQPKLEGEVQERLTKLMSELWVDEQRFTDAENARLVADRFLQHLRSDDSLAQERDPKLVKLVQTRLLRDDPLIADARALIEDINRSRPAIHLKDLVNPRVMNNGKRVIRPAYTRRIWEQELRESFQTLVENYDVDDWLLGQFGGNAAARKAERIARIHDYYFRAYRIEWRAFLDAIDLVTPNYEEEFIRNLDDLSHPAQPPLYALATAVDWNSNLPARQNDLKNQAFDQLKSLTPKAGKFGNKAGKLAAKAGKLANQANALLKAPQAGDRQRYMTSPQLRAAFADFVRFGVSIGANGASATARMGAPTQHAASGASEMGADLTRYLGHVRSLRSLLEAQQYGRDDTNSVQRKIQGLATQVQTLAREQPTSWRNWFERILYTPFRYATTTQQSQQERSLENQWCQLRGELDSKIFGRYPFKRHSSQDVNLVELAEFLHPKSGSLWKFQQDHLSDLSQRQGSRFERRQSHRAANRPLDRKIVNFLNAAAELAEILYPPGQMQPNVTFAVEAKPQSGILQTDFSFEGQFYSYANGSEHIQTMKWPGDKPEQGAKLKARHSRGDFELSKKGPWALFRLLEAGSILHTGPSSSLIVSWKTNSKAVREVTLYITAAQNQSILHSNRQQGFLHAFRRKDFKLPNGLLVGSRKCQ